MTISFILQLRIVAFDSANPNQKASALVTIAVTRNENSPIFARNSYYVEATESEPLGHFITTVNATDRDGVSKIYTCVKIMSEKK